MSRTSQAQTGDALAAGFASPPESAKPRAWWHWMNGNVTQEGIAKDFAWMKRVGIAGVQNFDAGLATPQVVENRLVYMSPEWKEAFHYAVQHAEALNLEFAIASSPGWSETGGPWVEPKDGMKKLVWSETIVEGGQRRDAPLTAPPSIKGPFQALQMGAGASTDEPPHFYADVAVLAYPVVASRDLPAPAVTTASGKIDPALLQGSDATGIPLPPDSADIPGCVLLEYEDQQIVCSAIVFVKNLPTHSLLGVTKGLLQTSEDGDTWRTLGEVELMRVPSTISFAPVLGRHFRMVFIRQGRDESFFTLAPGVDFSALTASAPKPPTPMLCRLQLFSAPRVNQFETKAGFSVVNDYFALDQHTGADVAGVAPEAVIDLTEHLAANGRLDWTPPAGRWKILRLGYSLTGKTNSSAAAEATGPEVDKFDAAAVEAYLNTYLDMYRDATGADLMGARGLTALLTDSTEVGPANWTPLMLEHFQRLRGYDPRSWLPALTGDIIGSRARSDAFLYDFRRTLAELHATEDYSTVAKVAHQRGMIVYGESLEGHRVALGDDLDMRSYTDVPMGALWSYGDKPRPNYVADVRGAASVAHLRGSTLVGCEALTSVGHPWAYAPRDLQPMMDAIFAHGVNRPLIHTSVHQPLDSGPGLSLGMFGQDFTRLDSWAEMARPWVDYISRNCYLLQQGRDVADVAYFYGEDTPVAVQAGGHYLPDTPTRYGYDFVSANALVELLSVDNGDIVSRGGARYKLLYLNAKSARMTLPTLRKLAQLAQAGATIVGDAPHSSPSLLDDPAEFADIVRRLWGGEATTEVNQGRVISGRNVEAALAQIGVTPDFMYTGESEIQFVHRRFDGGDLYFVTNRTDEAVHTEARFRIAGRAAELWHADTGEVEPTSYRIEGEQTVVLLDMRAHQSLFVVFRAPIAQTSVAVAKPSYRQIAVIDRAWDVAFQAGRGAPTSITLPALVSLSENSEPGVKYFSGVATYAKTFDLPAGVRCSDPLLIDLGAIGDIAEVRVNGQLAGMAWKSPYRVDIGTCVRAGQNELEIDVANVWVNRLIGDQQPGTERITFTTVPTFARDAPLRPSGLIGPVTLWAPRSDDCEQNR